MPPKPKEKKINLIKRNLEEIITEGDLRKLIHSGEKLKHYIGFEISGKIHLGSGLISMMKIKDFMDAGVAVTVFLADWHTWINDKLGGDHEKIKKVAVGYFKEGMKACMKCLGGNPEKINFLLGSDLYRNHNEYWVTVIDVSKNASLARIKRSITILGRKENEGVDFAKLIYPPMQVADIFFQGVHLAHAGMDQRKAHVIARDVALNLKIKPLLDKKGNKIKPVAVHQHILLGLGKPPSWPIPKDKLRDVWTSLKMSKSVPDSCVFIHDTPEEIRRKINNAFCPEGETILNPVLDWAKCLIFREKSSKLLIERPQKFGGKILYSDYRSLEQDFRTKKLHPMDLKNAVAENLIKLLEPVRRHFAKPRVKKMLQELDKMLLAK
ncbi:MAG: tyrosine--tRNA ligase [Candidatus Moranbacteria bacterium]|nr:tyrosine--tRNA ligase [Candidatus Moranbacteria bacterium]